MNTLLKKHSNHIIIMSSYHTSLQFSYYLYNHIINPVRELGKPKAVAAIRHRQVIRLLCVLQRSDRELCSTKQEGSSHRLEVISF